jgi:drug/metabolite transporter (DMT)-like permease
MRYVAATLYALAIVGGRRTVPYEWGVAFLVFVGTICTLFAVEAIVEHSLRKWKPK